jgi:putative peptide zinc metalloprotease protein
VSREDLFDAVVADRRIAARMMELLMLRDRPRRKEGVEEHVMREDERGKAVVLKDPETGKYYQLSIEGKFIWDLLDGSQSLRDLATTYLETFKSFSPHAIAEVVGGLGRAGFLESATWSDKVRRMLVRLPIMDRLATAVSGVLERVVVIRHVNDWFKMWYDRVAWPFFTRVGVAIQGLLVVAGVAATLQMSSISLEHFLDPPLWQLMGILIPALLISVIIHELAHGFAVKAFSREVAGVGVGWYWLGPIAFVDTSDMWLAPRWPRVAVSIAGPWSNLVVAGVVATATWLSGNLTASLFGWMFAVVSYIVVLFNLNPIMEYDGYYILADGLKRPNLRPQAVRWFFSGLPKAILQPSQFRGHLTELLYGVGSLLYTAALVWGLLWLYRQSFGAH